MRVFNRKHLSSFVLVIGVSFLAFVLMYFPGTSDAKLKLTSHGTKTVVVLGDSISFGAGAGDAQGDVAKHGWVRLLQSRFNAVNGSSNYGFVSSYSSNGTGREIHYVTQINSEEGRFWSAQQGKDATNLLNGWAVSSSIPGDKLRFSIVSPHNFIRVWYDEDKLGRFEVSMNSGEKLGVVDTKVHKGGLGKSDIYPIRDWGNGSTRIDIEVLSGEVAISGIEYLDDPRSFTLNNFSRDGREVKFLSDYTLTESCISSDILIFALGANDRLATGEDRYEVIERIEKLGNVVASNSCKLVIVDLLLSDGNDHWFRKALKRLHEGVKESILVSVPDNVLGAGMPHGYDQLIKSGISYDGTHLTVTGNQKVAEIVYDAMLREL